MKTLMTIVISVGASMMMMYFFIKRKENAKKCKCKKLPISPTEEQNPPPRTIGGFLDDLGINI